MAMTTTNTSLAREIQDYLRQDDTPNHVSVRYKGNKHTIFISANGDFGMLAPRKKKRGYCFYDWENVEKVFYPKNHEDQDVQARKIAKYKKLAASASFTNDFIRDIQKARSDKTLWENRITTGCDKLDGTTIKLSTIEKYCGYATMQAFRNAIKNREQYNSGRFDFQGYDGSLWVSPQTNGDMGIGFAKEYRGCGNGYYYLMINDDTMIFCDKD